jgi:TetR/AcrR family transcriptional regulator, transcriptional repressor for nem operon
LPRPSTRNAILEAGMKLFNERGFSACSVQDITDAADVPKGSFYNHFKSKEALAAELVTEYGKGVTDRSILTNAEIPRPWPPEEALRGTQRVFLPVQRWVPGR